MGGTLSLVVEFIPKGVTYRSTATVSTYCKVCKDTVDTITFVFDSNAPPSTCKQGKSTEESHRHCLYVAASEAEPFTEITF